MSMIFGGRRRHSDGLCRRSFLQIGGLGVGAGALTLADLVRGQAHEKTPRPHKAVIQICLGGGPPHQDLWDIKTEAPAEIRGEFRPISTRVTGVRIGEVFPKIAAVMDRCAIVRSVVGSVGQHDLYQCTTGWPGVFQPGAAIATSGRPSAGSVVGRLQGPVYSSVPPYVILQGPDRIPPGDGRKNAYAAGFLGAAHNPFDPDGAVGADLKLGRITPERLADRRRLLARFDTIRRDLDASGAFASTDAATQRAVEMLTSSKVLEALDLSREPTRVRDRYGKNELQSHYGENTWATNESLLLARRLVEAGVRCVTLNWGGWDSHKNNFGMVRGFGAKFDQAFSALVEDLDSRGLLGDVTVLAWGEFGRSPRINKDAGRDHWPQVSCALMAGGGMRTGQVIGATNRLGEYAQERPVHFQEIHATLYRNLGIGSSATITDHSGRPHHLVEHPPLRELV